MRTVWKFGPLTTYDDDLESEPQWIDLPAGYEIVHVGHQKGVGLYLWVEADTEASRITRGFLLYGTGWRLRPGVVHRGTVIAGEYVWHVYEVPA